MKNKLVLIPGITGRMGKEYASAFSKFQDVEVIGFSSKEDKISSNTLYCDFLNLDSVDEVINKINLQKYTDIFLIHSIGPFLFEENGDVTVGINKEIFELNYQTLVNVCEKIKNNLMDNQNFIIGAFGSISDRLNIPWWKSYSDSKNKLKEYIIENIGSNIRGVFINVSSTEKEEERPFADKTFWLKCSEIVERSMDSLLNSKLNFQEIYIIKINPNYKKDYFKNLKELKNKWIRETYGK